MAKQKMAVTTVGMIHQRSLAAIVALEGGPIKTPADLIDKSIGDQPGSTNTVMFPLYAKAVGIPADKTRFVPASPPALPQLLAAGKFDGIGQFVVGAPLVEKADSKHRKAVVLPYGEVLPDLYGNAIITRTDLAKDHPDQVKKFTGALLKGLQDTIDNPAEAAKTMQKYVPKLDVAVATAELNLMKQYVKPAGFQGQLGEVDQERVTKIIAALVAAGQVPANLLTPADVVDGTLAPKG
jgi:NitT/TauT family transport system substrate-binding protein